MVCANCGAKIGEGQNFCSVCGKTVASPPVAPVTITPSSGPRTASGRLQRHLRILTILWLVWAVLRLIPGIGLLFFFGRFGLPFLPFNIRALMMPISAFIGAFFLAYAVAAFIAAWGLMERRPWARILTIVLGILALIHPPFGTALGIYTLWVMWPPESESEYRRLSGPV
ncbi:MAG: DUF2127 domain-containing protein [Terriglobia bacterium]